MRTTAVVVATLVLLAGASSALVAAESAAPSARTATPDAMDSPDAVGSGPSAVGVQENATEVTLSNLTIERLNLTNVSAEYARLNETLLVGANGTSSLGTATASNLTVVNATLRNVTLENVTIRNQDVVDALFPEGVPEGDTATVENATLAELNVSSIAIETGFIEDAEVNNVSAGISLAPSDPPTDFGEAAIEAENMTVGSIVLDEVEAESVGVENASVGMTGGFGNGTSNESAARRAPDW